MWSTIKYTTDKISRLELASVYLIMTDMASTSQSSDTEDQLVQNCSLTAGPHQPVLKFPKRTFGKQQRSFSASWYGRYPMYKKMKHSGKKLSTMISNAYRKVMFSNKITKPDFSSNDR